MSAHTPEYQEWAKTKTADVRLAAAAPELLRALEVLLHSVDRRDEAGSPASDAAIDQALAAISKAGGNWESGK